MVRRYALYALVAAAVLAGARRPAATAAPERPALAVLIVVDQMRADYVDRFQAEWTGGLKRLVRDGAWFPRAAYPYLSTVTCAGHATVATGTLPRTHGIIQNTWWDRDRQAMVTCTADPDATNIGSGGRAAGGDDAHALRVPTLADILRTGHGAHVVTVVTQGEERHHAGRPGGRCRSVAQRPVRPLVVFLDVRRTADARHAAPLA